MRKLMQWVEARNDRQRWAKLIERVAERSQNAVWRRVYPSISQMGFHEACGYIRARSAVVIQSEMRLVTAETPIDPTQQSRLCELASHRVIRNAMTELMQQQSPMRRAA